MLKIAYDHQIYTLQKYGGISRYFCDLAAAIAKLDDCKIDLYAGLYQNQYLENYPNLAVRGSEFEWPIPRRIVGGINDRLNRIALRNAQPDIVHATYYSSQRLAPPYSKVILTVHDMIHERFTNAPEHSEFLRIKAKAIAAADRLICVSHSTRQDLLERFELDEERVSTIYLGFSGLTKSNQIEKSIIDRPYILYVGDRVGIHKNFTRMLQAYANSRKIRNNFKLVCFGVNSLSTAERSMMAELGIGADEVACYSGDDSILANLYLGAAVLVYPSLYEGFGIPPLEAMSFDCPVACSNTSSIPEVVADAGEYFNPAEVDSIRDAIEKVLFSNTRSAELRTKGRARLPFFSWDKCARETLAVYRSSLARAEQSYGCY